MRNGENKRMRRLMMIVILLFGVCGGSVTSFASGLVKKDEYLIMFQDNVDKGLIEKQGGEVKEVYSNLPIVKAEFSYDPIDTLKQHSEVVEVEQDGNVKANGTEKFIHNGISSVLLTKEKGVSPLTGKGTSVAILDTGIDRKHPDLKIKDGISFVENVSDFDDDNGHGTHLAGIVSAQNNGVGITGIAPDADLYAVKVLDKYTNGKYSTVVKGIDWAIEHNINIVLMSLGGKKDSIFFEQAMNKAYQKGILLVASAGNEGYKDENSITYPAKFNSVIAVGALDNNDQRGFLSSKGEELDLMAPGVDILSTWPQGDYKKDSGTSMAAAHVAGVAALIFERKPNLSNEQIRDIMNKSAIPLGNPFEYGNGKVSISNSLKMLD